MSDVLVCPFSLGRGSEGLARPPRGNGRLQREALGAAAAVQCSVQSVLLSSLRRAARGDSAGSPQHSER